MIMVGQTLNFELGTMPIAIYTLPYSNFINFKYLVLIKFLKKKILLSLPQFIGGKWNLLTLRNTRQLVQDRATTSILVARPPRPLIILKPLGSTASIIESGRIWAPVKKKTCRAISNPSSLMNKTTVWRQETSEKDIFMSPKYFLCVMDELSVYHKQSNYIVPCEPHFLCAGVCPGNNQHGYN